MSSTSSTHFRRRPVLFCCIAAALLALAMARQHERVYRAYLDLRALCVTHLAEDRSRREAPDNALARFLLDDFADLDHYREANSRLPPASPGRVIFYGDSITEYWSEKAPQQFFPAKHYLNRGVAGQTTPELLWRFHQDVLALHPDTVVLLAGVNDIFLARRHISAAETRANLRTLIELAQRHHIRVILCALLPTSVASPATQARLTSRIQSLNAWQRQYAAEQHLTYVDYFSALSDVHGAMLDGFSRDGIHPNSAGYARMQPLAQHALDTTP